MIVRSFVVLLAFTLVAASLWLERRSRPKKDWRGYCPCCENPIRLPRDKCPYCGADLNRADYRYALEFEFRDSEYRRLARLWWSHVLVVAAGLLLVGLFLSHIWT